MEGKGHVGTSSVPSLDHELDAVSLQEQWRSEQVIPQARQQQREPDDTVVVGELNIVCNHAVPQAEAGSGKLSGHAGVHSVIVARVQLQRVPQQSRQKLFVRDFLVMHKRRQDEAQRDSSLPPYTLWNLAHMTSDDGENTGKGKGRNEGVTAEPQPP